MIGRLFSARFVRFGLVAVAGLAIDLGIAWVLARAGLALPLAAAIGFTTAAAVNYVLHERWTFRTGALSARRGGGYLAVLLATLALRTGAVAALQATLFPHPEQRLLPLLIAVALSFCLNFALSRRFVFVSRAA